MTMRLAAGVLTAIVVLAWTSNSRAAQTTTTVVLLDRYLAGQFDPVVASLATLDSFDGTLEDLEREGAAWIDRGAPAERDRRELAAATFALEAARLGEWKAWKVIGSLPKTSEFKVYWQAPPLLIEWACVLVRQRAQPASWERLWWMASVAVAERAEDPEFLAGHVGENIVAPVLQHARHAQLRFPRERRFNLADGIAEEWRNVKLARSIFERLQDDIDVGAEALVRLGVLAWRERDYGRAATVLKRAEGRTLDPWLLYLARYFGGQTAAARRDPAEAVRLYRLALDAMPRAQSASVALAAIEIQTGRVREAATVIDAMLAASTPTDPWREYAHGDDRFWPQLRASLRHEIHP